MLDINIHIPESSQIEDSDELKIGAIEKKKEWNDVSLCELLGIIYHQVNLWI